MLPRMFDDQSLDAALQRIDEWERSATRRAEQAQELARRAAQISATARSRDGHVEVTVGSEGQIQRLHLDERIRQQPASETASQIMAMLREAQGKLVRQFDQVTAETVGEDSETGRMLRESLRKRLGAEDA
jgi:DNA-binding protein YbaB